MIERNVTSLELSKKLEEFKLRNYSLFVWECFSDGICGVKYAPYAVVPDMLNRVKWFWAYTASELLELIPTCIDTKQDEPFNNFRLRIEKFTVYEEGYFPAYSVKYICDTYEATNPLERKLHSEWDISLCDALAKMIIYLKENNLWHG